MEDLPEGEREMLKRLALPSFNSTPFVAGKPLSERRVSVVSTAALQRRDDRVFGHGEASYRVIQRDTDPNDIIMSHGSVNFDRSGFQQDLNVCFPLERLKELAAEGFIGSVADFHYTVSGAVDPRQNEDSAREIAGLMRREGVDTVLLVPI
jgi:D-proline reductase (dithiol) PrdB